MAHMFMTALQVASSFVDGVQDVYTELREGFIFRIGIENLGL